MWHVVGGRPNLFENVPGRNLKWWDGGDGECWSYKTYPKGVKRELVKGGVQSLFLTFPTRF
jgi:hypothetical protein